MQLTDDYFEQLRHIGDPSLDPIMAEIKQSGQAEEVNRLLSELIRNHEAIPAELPDNIENWLKEHKTLPPEVDMARLDRAAAFFTEHGALITLILSTAALVTCYAGKKGSQVLTFSYRMNQNPYHRIAETGQFVLFVMAPGAFAPEGEGLMACLKVRMMHAAVRYLIQRSGKWDEADRGIPICQEDTLGTLMVFSVGVLEGLRRLGIVFTPEQAEDYYYGWQVIGQLMGILPEIIPADVTSGTATAHFIAQRQFGPSPEGIFLTRSLLEMHNDLIPGTMFDGIVPALIRQLADDNVADWMEVPQSRWQKVINHTPKAGRVLEILDNTFGGLEDMIDRLALSLLMRNSINVNNYSRASFHIPQSLHKSWVDKLPPAGENEKES